MDYIDAGAHIAPHCGTTNAKLRANIPVFLTKDTFSFTWSVNVFEPKVFLGEQVTLGGTTHKTALGQPSFRQRVADQILEVNFQSFSGKAKMGKFICRGILNQHWHLKYFQWREYFYHLKYFSGGRTNSQFGTTRSRTSWKMKVELLRLPVSHLQSFKEITFEKPKTNLSGSSDDRLQTPGYRTRG